MRLLLIRRELFQLIYRVREPLQTLKWKRWRCNGCSRPSTEAWPVATNTQKHGILYVITIKQVSIYSHLRAQSLSHVSEFIGHQYSSVRVRALCNDFQSPTLLTNQRHGAGSYLKSW